MSAANFNELSDVPGKQLAILIHPDEDTLRLIVNQVVLNAKDLASLNRFQFVTADLEYAAELIGKDVSYFQAQGVLFLNTRNPMRLKFALKEF